MIADHQAYRRAASVSLLGLLIQTALGLVMLLFGIFADNSAALTGAFAILLGLPIWLSLGLVFQQHKLERLEFLEFEALAAEGAGEATVFEDISAEQVQAQKLAFMHKWFLPVVSILGGLAYMGIGIYLFSRSREAMDAGAGIGGESGWAIAVGVGVAFVGFVFARFVAGMAKQEAWSLLHAGAAASVGSAFVGALLALAHFLNFLLGNKLLLEYLPLIFSIYMVGLGLEMLLNFVLNLYRPRKPGEYLRPAFDSRVLAFLAAPDRVAESISEAINYQFGFNVSSTWFYQLLSKMVVPLLVLGLLMVWGLSCFAVVKPDERGLLLRSGRIVREVEPGLVLKMPWPFDRVIKHPASTINEIVVGSGHPPDGKPVLWTTTHTSNEEFMLVQPTRKYRVESGTESRDLALIAASFPIQFKVTDLRQYMNLAQDGPSSDLDAVRRDVLESFASSVIIDHLATYSIDDLLTDRRDAIREQLKTLLDAEFKRIGAGIEVVFVGMTDVHPPKDVADSFERIVRADQQRLEALDRARAAENDVLAKEAGEVSRVRQIMAMLEEIEALKAANASEEVIAEQEIRVMDMIVEAGGAAGTEIANARADRWDLHMSERTRAKRNLTEVLAYRAAPEAFRANLYLQALEDAMSNARIFIIPFENPEIVVDKLEVDSSSLGLDMQDIDQLEADSQE